MKIVHLPLSACAALLASAALAQSPSTQPADYAGERCDVELFGLTATTSMDDARATLGEQGFRFLEGRRSSVKRVAQLVAEREATGKTKMDHATGQMRHVGDPRAVRIKLKPGRSLSVVVTLEPPFERNWRESVQAQGIATRLQDWCGSTENMRVRREDGTSCEAYETLAKISYRAKGPGACIYMFESTASGYRESLTNTDRGQ